MSEYAAEIDSNNVVTRLIVCDSLAWAEENLGGTWVASDTKVPAHSTYDADRDAFIPPTPYPSWVLDEATCLWVAPIDYPADGGQYVWDEETTDWVEVQDETV